MMDHGKMGLLEGPPSKRDVPKAVKTNPFESIVEATLTIIKRKPI